MFGNNLEKDPVTKQWFIINQSVIILKLNVLLNQKRKKGDKEKNQFLFDLDQSLELELRIISKKSFTIYFVYQLKRERNLRQNKLK